MTGRSLGVAKFRNAAVQTEERGASSRCHQSTHQTGGSSVSSGVTVHTAAFSSNTTRGFEFHMITDASTAYLKT